MSRYGLLILTVLLHGCSSAGNQISSGVEPEITGPVWPQAPARARIEYISQFSVANDLGLRQRPGRRLLTWMAGGEDRSMSRPYSIAATEDKLIVTDPDAAIVHFFDLKKKTYRAITGTDQARFASPIGVAIGGNRFYVSDSVLNQVYEFDESMRLKNVLQGFQRPTGLAFSEENQRLYVVDTKAHHIRVFDREGRPEETIGERGDGSGQFNFPTHIAAADGVLVVNDTLNFRVQTLSLQGDFIAQFGDHGRGAGSFHQSKGVALDSDGHIYVADARSDWIQVFDRQGEFLLVFGSPGEGAGQFNMPTGMTFVDDRLYVADSMNHRVQVFRYLAEEDPR